MTADDDPSDASDRCLSCGATLGKAAEWCPQCYAPVETQEPEPTFAAPDAFIGPRMQVDYSRSAKTDVSYGRVGRIVWTFLLVVLPLLFLFWTVFPFGIVYLVAACPILLPAIWKKTPVRKD